MAQGPKQRFEEFKSYVREEFIQHLPFTLIGVVAGLAIVLAAAVFKSLAFGENEYHTAHFFHLFFSGAASAAIVKSYRNSIMKAVPVAFFSSITLCTVSDVLIPVMGLLSFGYPADIHVCIVEEPLIVMGCVLAGSALGLVGIQFFDHCNRGFHLLHILISTAASTFYMLTYIATIDMVAVSAIFISLFFALAVPCLVGDMVLPLCFVSIKDEYLHERVHHHHHS